MGYFWSSRYDNLNATHQVFKITQSKVSREGATVENNSFEDLIKSIKNNREFFNKKIKRALDFISELMEAIQIFDAPYNVEDILFEIRRGQEPPFNTRNITGYQHRILEVMMKFHSVSSIPLEFTQVASSDAITTIGSNYQINHLNVFKNAQGESMLNENTLALNPVDQIGSGSFVSLSNWIFDYFESNVDGLYTSLNRDNPSLNRKRATFGKEDFTIFAEGIMKYVFSANIYTEP